MKSIFFSFKRLAIALVVISLALPAQAQSAGNSTPMTPGPRPENDGPGRVDDAIRTLFGVLKPQDEAAAGETARLERFYQEGVAAERAGDFQEAFELYEKALSISYGDPRIHVALGRLLEPRDPALAIFHYQLAFRFAIAASAEKVPAIEVMRRFLVGRYLQYALPVDDPEVSANLLELAQSLAPEDPRIHAQLASTYFQKGMYRRAVQENRNAIALGLENGVIYTNLAVSYAQLGMESETGKILEYALNFDERNVTEVLNLIRLAEEADTIVGFSDVLGTEKLSQLVDNSARGRLEKALESWESGNKAEAIKLARSATDAAPQHSHSMIVLGDLQRAQGDTGAAKSAYENALKRSPENALAQIRLGDISFDMKDYSSAAEYYMSAMDLLNGALDKIDILDRTAVALAQNNKHSEALELLDKWLKLNPNAQGAFELSVRRAGILSDASRTREAELLLRGLVDRDRTNPAGYVVLSTFYREQGNDKRARQVINDGIVRFESAIEADPLDPALYRDLARLARVVGQEDRARKAELQGGLRTGEKRYFSNALFLAGADDMAFEVLKSWVTSEPMNPEAILSYGWVAAKLNREVPLALSQIQTLVLQRPEMEMAPVYRSRSYLYFASGEYEKAIEDINRVLSSDNVAQAAFFHRLWGMSAEALGRETEALTHYRRAVELDPVEHDDLGGRISALQG